MEESREGRGKGALAFALIPAALGGAALMWLATYTGIIGAAHEATAYRHAETLQERMDGRVGVVAPLSNPVNMIIQNKGCFKITKAYMDGNSGVAYLNDGCPSSVNYQEFHWAAKAPNGTIIDSHYKNWLGEIRPGDTMEYRFDLPNDDRIASFEVWTSTRD